MLQPSTTVCAGRLGRIDIHTRRHTRPEFHCVATSGDRTLSHHALPGMTVETLAMSAATMPASDSAALFHKAKQHPGSLKRKFEGTSPGISTGSEEKRGENATLEAAPPGPWNPGLSPNPAQKAGVVGRQNSLRRVKNSTDVLRQRSTKATSSDIAPDGLSGGREGRQFTVANVGNNGMIYLR